MRDEAMFETVPNVWLDEQVFVDRNGHLSLPPCSILERFLEHLRPGHRSVLSLVDV